MTLLLQKCEEKNNKALHSDTKTFSILRDILPWYLKKFVHVLFCVFQTNLNKAVTILCKLPEGIRNIQMIQCFNAMKTWMRILPG